MAGAAPERQERGVVNAIKNAVRKNARNPITVIAGSTKISNIIDARKYAGRSSSGEEPYTDVQFITKDRKVINLSLKGEAAPSLAGGGLSGLQKIIPGIVSRFMNAVLDKLKSMGLNPGDKVPDVYGAISGANKKKIVVGNTSMGGPIDYMYIGPMDVRSQYDTEKNQLHFIGAALTPSEEYAKTHNLFFRLRARRVDQRFDPEATRAGMPRIYSVSPTRGDSAGRIVVTDSVPKEAVMVNI